MLRKLILGSALAFSLACGENITAQFDAPTVEDVVHNDIYLSDAKDGLDSYDGNEISKDGKVKDTYETVSGVDVSKLDLVDVKNEDLMAPELDSYGDTLEGLVDVPVEVTEIDVMIQDVPQVEVENDIFKVDANNDTLEANVQETVVTKDCNNKVWKLYGPYENTLSKLFEDEKGNIYVIGIKGGYGTPLQPIIPLIFYFDGKNLNEMPLPQMYGNTNVSDIWGKSSKEMLVLGCDGSTTAPLFQYDSTNNKWINFSNPLTSNNPLSLKSITGRSLESLFVSGGYDSDLHEFKQGIWIKHDLPPEYGDVMINKLYTIQDLFLIIGSKVISYDNNWHDLKTSDKKLILEDAWGDSSTNLYVVGNKEDLNFKTEYAPAIFHYDGKIWENLDLSFLSLVLYDSYKLKNISANGPKDIYVGDVNHDILIHYNGNSWEKISLPYTKQEISGFEDVVVNKNGELTAVLVPKYLQSNILRYECQ